MSEANLWRKAIEAVLVAILGAIVCWWMEKSRAKTRPNSESCTLAHPRGTLIIAMVGICFFLTLFIATLMVFKNNLRAVTVMFWICFSLSLISFFLLFQYFVEKHRLTPEGLRYRKLLGTEKFLLWSDVKRAHFSIANQWFLVKTNRGEVARISVMLMGLPAFAAYLLKYAPPEAIDPKSLPIFVATAQGHPPKL
jgi:uncharacterized Tic20 family protein